MHKRSLIRAAVTLGVARLDETLSLLRDEHENREGPDGVSTNGASTNGAHRGASAASKLPSPQGA